MEKYQIMVFNDVNKSWLMLCFFHKHSCKKIDLLLQLHTGCLKKINMHFK